MWVTKKKWNRLLGRITALENRIQKTEKVMDKKLYEMTKEILRQPEELLEEIENRENTDKFIEDFLRS